jgi:hypothetical protein
MKSAQIVYHVTAKLHVAQYFFNFWLCNEEKMAKSGKGISHKIHVINTVYTIQN